MLPSQLPVFTVLVLLIALALAGCLDDDPDDLDDGEDFSGPVSASGNETADENGNETTGGGQGNNTNENEDPSNGGGDNKTDDGGGGDDNETSYFDPGWPEIGAAAIRPGVTIVGGSCTANFIFSSPDNRTLYIGTASHCVGGQNPNDTISIAGGHSGTLVYCSWMHTEGGDECPSSDTLLDNNDFALVRIDDGDRDAVHPALLHWNGPTGLGDGLAVGDRVYSYGHSSLKPHEALRPMEGYVTHYSPSMTSVVTAPPGVFGDSGSPVIAADGSTVGVFVAIGTGFPGTGPGLVSNLRPDLEFMTAKTGIEVELKTWDAPNTGILP